MKIVFLDRKSIGDDISLKPFEDFGEVVTYGFSDPDEVPDRVRDADIIIVNKVPVNERTISTAERLRLVCVTATGTNNLDKEYLDSRGIAWRNVAGYSTETVAQHTFALLFYLFEHLGYYDNYVKSGGYAGDRLFTHFERQFHELSGKTWGVIGLGAIGKRVAQIAQAFGCKVIYYSTSGKNHDTEYTEVSIDELLAKSDIVSIHAPLDERTEGLIGSTELAKMKPSAILINMGRGPIIVESDLAEALKKDVIAGAGLDVLCVEPMSKESPFLNPELGDKIFITPHIAWASIEARVRLMDIIAGQVRDFISENP